jgi:hypothetical protein
MYLFTRTRRITAGDTREAIAWAIGITEKVNQITSLNASLWTTFASPGNGTLAWSTFIEDLTVLETATDKLAVDDLAASELERGKAYTPNGADDEVAQLLSGDVDPSQQPKYALVIRSELAPGGFAKGIEAGVEMATRATAVGDVTTSFLLSTTGKYGGVAWISSADTIAALEASAQKVNADAELLALIDRSGPAFVPGITTQTIYARIV